jgi:hypothetical protein
MEVVIVRVARKVGDNFALRRLTHQAEKTLVLGIAGWRHSHFAGRHEWPMIFVLFILLPFLPVQGRLVCQHVGSLQRRISFCASFS